jgi:hypothetical protein
VERQRWRLGGGKQAGPAAGGAVQYQYGLPGGIADRRVVQAQFRQNFAGVKAEVPRNPTHFGWGVTNSVRRDEPSSVRSRSDSRRYTPRLIYPWCQPSNAPPLTDWASFTNERLRMDLAAMAVPGNFPFNILFQKVFQRQYYYERPLVVEMRGYDAPPLPAVRRVPRM